MKTEEESKRDFILGLEALTRETGIIIAGCGCCGSPFLLPLNNDHIPPEAGYAVVDEDEELTWTDPTEDEEDDVRRIVK